MQATILTSHEFLGEISGQVVGRGQEIASHAEGDARSQRMRVTLVLPLKTNTASRTAKSTTQPHIWPGRYPLNLGSTLDQARTPLSCPPAGIEHEVLSQAEALWESKSQIAGLACQDTRYKGPVYQTARQNNYNNQSTQKFIPSRGHPLVRQYVMRWIQPHWTQPQ